LKQDSVPMKIKEVLLAAFTYFAPTPQKAVLERIAASLSPHGLLVIGSHENFPGESKGSPCWR
jgi:chemotaxis methyl-accepting protein methylase